MVRSGYDQIWTWHKDAACWHRWADGAEDGRVPQAAATPRETRVRVPVCPS